MKTVTEDKKTLKSELKILINRLPILTATNRGTKEEETKRSNEDEPLITKYLQALNEKGELNDFLQSEMYDNYTVQNVLTTKRYQVLEQNT